MMHTATTSMSAVLAGYLREFPRLVVLSGAGVSTGSGIPDYRDRDGAWKHSAPIQFGDFARDARYRQRYWARSYLGWPRFGQAAPNAAHHALATLQAVGRIDTVITQNVDRLHQAAGSKRVIDLHGTLGRVRCMGCQQTEDRDVFQDRLSAGNPAWRAAVFRYKPDGDADIAESSYEDFIVPACLACGGVQKPDVVMFGESVPRGRVEMAMEAVESADGMLVVGTSLMVFSGFRFVRHAAARGKPVAIVNRGHTRADELAALKLDADVGVLLPAALRTLEGLKSGDRHDLPRTGQEV